MISFKFTQHKSFVGVGSQKHHIMTKRPSRFPRYKSLSLPKPPRLLSKETQTELQEVRDAMVMSVERLQYEKT